MITSKIILFSFLTCLGFRILKIAVHYFVHLTMGRREEKNQTKLVCIIIAGAEVGPQLPLVDNKFDTHASIYCLR